MEDYNILCEMHQDIIDVRKTFLLYNKGLCELDITGIVNQLYDIENTITKLIIEFNWCSKKHEDNCINYNIDD